MHSDADAFLDAIDASPADDLPRLVYADWLEEHGHPDYAAFIRLSCRIARRERQHPDERARLRRDRYAAFRGVRTAYPQAVDGLGLGVNEFDRGLLRHPLVVASAEAFVRDSAAWWPVARPRRVRLLASTGREAEVLSCPYLAVLERLEVYGNQREERYHPQWAYQYDLDPLSGRFLLGLGDGSSVPRLTALRVELVRATATELAAFAGSPLAARLDWLGLAVELPDGEFGEVWADGLGTAREAIDRFVVEHRFRLPE
ncbi:MAG: TIGR02996 domain-containing protein [Gemmataceae bacterium]|nr:TIGR02996 domain-containing protein [Gemmataceae bacterium]